MRSSLAAACLGFPLLAAPVLAQTPRLLADINRQPGPPASSLPSAMAWVGNTLFFAAYAPDTGVELYRSFGTAQSTTLLRDLEPGPLSSTPQGFASIGGATVFLTEGDLRAPRARLWRTDGTAAGTAMLADLGAHGTLADLYGVFPLQGFGIFALSNIPGGLTLHRTDGTAAGTTLVERLNAYPAPGTTTHVAEFAGALWLNVDGALVRTDGTDAGTDVFLQFITPGPLAVLGGALYFCTASGLMRTDGTPAGTTQIVADTFDGGVTRLGSNVYCHGMQGLWRSDGTIAGTTLLRPFTAAGRGLGNTPGVHYFAGNDAATGLELWRTDGTAAGTSLVKDLTPGPGHSTFSSFGVLGSRLVFTTSPSGSALWVSDGTGPGTVQLPPHASGTSPSAFAADPTGTFLTFAADHPATGREPWRTDGTVSGTALLVDLANPPGGTTRGSQPFRFMQLPGRTLFFANDGLAGHELWSTSGTASGTQLVKDIYPGTVGSVSPSLSRGEPASVVVGGVAYFAASDPVAGEELWRSDGTAAGTQRVADLVPGSNGSYPEQFVALDERRFVFTAMAFGLVVSDGTAAGTFPLLPQRPNEVMRVGQRLLLAYAEPATGVELWTSDGTVAGTRMLVDLTPGPASTYPRNFCVLGDAVYFSVARQSPLISELWRTDGTAGGTTLVVAMNREHYNLTAANGKLYFVGTDGQYGAEPWVSDGTAAGTQLLADTNPGPPSGMGPGRFVGVRDGVVFGDAQGALWRTDGTPASTLRISGPVLTPPSLAFASGRYAWFARPDGLWRTDASAAGTVRVLARALLPNSVPPVTRVGHRVLAVHDDGVLGDEPWTVEEGMAAAAALGTGCGNGWRTPRLDADDPVLGRGATLRASQALPGAGVAMVLGAPLDQPAPWPDPSCAIHLAPWLALPAMPVGAQWVFDLQVPAPPVFLGTTVVAQAVCFPGQTPAGFDLSNGIALTLGR